MPPVAEKKNGDCGSIVLNVGAWEAEKIAMLGGVDGMLSVNSSVSAQGLRELLQLENS